MAKTNSDGSVMHLRKDPNDPRLNKPAEVGFSVFEDDPEQEPTAVEVTHAETDQGVVHLGVDPNDPRLVAGLK